MKGSGWYLLERNARACCPLAVHPYEQIPSKSGFRNPPKPTSTPLGSQQRQPQAPARSAPRSGSPITSCAPARWPRQQPTVRQPSTAVNRRTTQLLQLRRCCGAPPVRAACGCPAAASAPRRHQQLPQTVRQFVLPMNRRRRTAMGRPAHRRFRTSRSLS